MARAIWKNKVLAESEEFEFVDGNVYFPMESLNREFLQDSEHTSVCPWKGKARYFDVVVEGETNPNAAWYYPNPSDQASAIKNHVAFWKGVEVDQ